MDQKRTKANGKPTVLSFNVLLMSSSPSISVSLHSLKHACWPIQDYSVMEWWSVHVIIPVILDIGSTLLGAKQVRCRMDAVIARLKKVVQCWRTVLFFPSVGFSPEKFLRMQGGMHILESWLYTYPTLTAPTSNLTCAQGQKDLHNNRKQHAWHVWFLLTSI